MFRTSGGGRPWPEPKGKDIGWLCTSEPLGRYKTLYLSKGRNLSISLRIKLDKKLQDQKTFYASPEFLDEQKESLKELVQDTIVETRAEQPECDT